MKKLFCFLLLVFCWVTSLFAQEEASIYNMWSWTDGKRNYAIDIDKDSLSISFSEKDKWSASNRVFYGIVAFENNGNKGRIICNRDSLGMIQYKTLDFFGLNEDSVKIYLFQEIFADENQARSALAADVKLASVYYTTAYLYYKKIEEKTTVLKKADYLSFLKDAQVEAKKRAAAKTLPMNPKTPVDKRIQEFLFSFAKEKQYKGKIFPGILEKAIKNYEKDEAVKKLMSGIKTNFVIKKDGTPSAPENDKKSDDSKKTKSTSKSGELQIKTEEVKKK